MERGDLVERLRGLSEAEFEALVAVLTQVVIAVVRRLDEGGLAADPGGLAAAAGPIAAHAARSFPGAVLVEDDVLDARRRGVNVLRVARTTVLSPLALDTAREAGIRVEREV